MISQEHNNSNSDTNNDTSTVSANTHHKDNLFRLLFKDKNNLLSLYNALNSTSYTDPDLIEVTTIDNFIYMEMKNDVSFILDCTLNLFEHQSTNNPNMPLRGLFYFAQHYGKIVSKKALHKSTLIKIPTPRYVVFYNGKKPFPESKVLKLSDAFFNQSVKGCMEVEATILNINYGRNKEIMDKCKVLFEYATFVKTVRDFVESGEYDSNDIAIDKAVQHCINHKILANVLQMHRAEVIEMFFSEYTMEDAIADAVEDAVEDAKKAIEQARIEAKKEAKKEAIEEYQHKLDEKDDIINEKDDIIRQLQEQLKKAEQRIQ